jgi:hypothetical protein
MTQTGADEMTCWLIWSLSGRAWWLPDGRGTTGFLSGAGRWTRADAERILACSAPGDIELVPDPYGSDAEAIDLRPGTPTARSDPDG